MCGKFTQMAEWAEIVTWKMGETPSEAAARQAAEGGAKGGGGGKDDIVTSTPMRMASILRLNADGEREMAQMRWGFAERGAATPSRPKHMHVRAETIDQRVTFAESFRLRRGICFVRTFNEGEEVGKKTVQWTITPKDAQPIAIAVIYEEWTNGPDRLLTFVQVTTPANALISKITDRMPAVLRPEHYALWLGEDRAPLEEVKAILVPYDDAGTWDMAPEPKKPRVK